MAPKPLLDKDTPRSDAPPGEKLSNREAINQTLNEPSYSPLAMIISNVVMISIVISTVSFVISSMPAFQDEGSKAALAVVEVVVVGIRLMRNRHCPHINVEELTPRSVQHECLNLVRSQTLFGLLGGYSSEGNSNVRFHSTDAANSRLHPSTFIRIEDARCR